jgi:hypothetical protein
MAATITSPASAAREVFADLRKVDSRFEVVDLTGGPAALKIFGAKKYDITLCLATYHKLKRIMEPAELSALMQHFGKATKIFRLARHVRQAGRKRAGARTRSMSTSASSGWSASTPRYISAELGVAAIWARA